MTNIKNFIFTLLITIFLILFSVVVINIFYYFNLLSENIYRFFKILSIIISIFTGGFIIGRKSNNKGYLNGIVFGLILICFSFILCLIFSSIQFKLFIYYLVIITSACLGGTIGIHKKKKH